MLRHSYGALDSYGAFWALGTKTSKPLKNTVHPLWKQDNYRMGGYTELDARCRIGLHLDDPGSRIPDGLYKTVEPVFRLASVLLAYFRQFYTKMRRAEEVPVKGVNVLISEGNLRGRNMLQCLDPTWHTNPEDETAYGKAVEEIAGHFRLYCGQEKARL